MSAVEKAYRKWIPYSLFYLKGEQGYEIRTMNMITEIHEK